MVETRRCTSINVKLAPDDKMMKAMEKATME